MQAERLRDVWLRHALLVPAVGLCLTPTKHTVQIWIYKDKATGEPKGDATITYEDPFAAHQAPSWFDGKEFLGK